MELPASLSEVAAAIELLLPEIGPSTEAELVTALQDRGVDLGIGPADTVAAAIDEQAPALLQLLGDGRYVLLSALLADRTLTHRVTAVEIEHGFLEVTPDLEPFSLLTEEETYRRLVDGSPAVEAVRDVDLELLAERGIAPDALIEAALVLEPDALSRLGLTAGDLVAVTVRPEGFELTAVPNAEGRPDLAARLAETLEQLGDGGPALIDTLVWLACADDPESFGSPTPPLTELFEAVGLIWRKEQVGPPGFDFGAWWLERRLGDIAEQHDLDEDAALAVLLLTQLYDDVRRVVDLARDATDAGQPTADSAEAVGPEVAGLSSSDTDPEDGGFDDEVVREALHFLTDSRVAEAVLLETLGACREGAAALGVFAETLEPRAPRQARAALHWLRGRACDRLGDTAGAEQAFEAALDLDGEWRPALFDLADIASDRGDAERGLSLLRRAGAPSDDGLVVLLERFRPTDRKGLGRNEPCWCGSGRKYKACHRGRETRPLEERAFWLYQKAAGYLGSGPWRAGLLDLAEIRSWHWEQTDAVYAALEDPLVCDAMLFEGGAFGAFLDERGTLLPDDERLLAEQWLLAERSVFEVETVTAGTGFTARDLRTGDRLEVRERVGSGSLRPGMLICCRLVPAGDTVQCFGGLEPVELHQRDELLRLLDDHPGPDELVTVLSGRFAPPVLQNTEGDPLAFCEAHLHSPDAAALATALDEAYERDDQEPRWFERVLTHGRPHIRATLKLDGEHLTVETNSEARLDRVLDRLRSLRPEARLVEQTRQPADGVREAIGRQPPDPGRSGSLDPAANPEIAAALEQFSRAHEAAWLDEQIPALAGATPREAAADPTRRPDLIRLLDSFGPAEPGLMDPDRLRAELGL